MKIDRFEDIVSWQRAKNLTVEIYKTFENQKDFSFKSQIQRASLSIMNNIAEGFERKTNKEFMQFLFIAKGSAGEVRSMLYLALELKYINNDQFKKLFDEVIIISKMLSNFIKTL
ncbi:MAG: four helix bundle protein [Ignavibacteriae bacterium]|nr:four helix bundle protein [Ignavibacteriota bacterium]